MGSFVIVQSQNKYCALETNERKEKWGGDNNKCEKCEKRGERIEETLEHILTECSEYGEERDRLDERIGNKLGPLWGIRKREEDKGLQTMLGLKDKSEEVVKYTKEFLKTIWRKRNGKMRLGREAGRSDEHNYVRGN